MCIYHNSTNGMEDSLLRPYASSLRSRACQDHCNLRPPSRKSVPALLRPVIRWLQPRTTSGATKEWRAKVHGFPKERISCVTRCTDETHRMAGCINQLQPEKGQISAANFFEEIFRCKLKGLFCSYRLTFHTKFVTFWNISRPWKSRAKEKMRMLNLVGGWSGWCLLFNKFWFCLILRSERHVCRFRWDRGRFCASTIGKYLTPNPTWCLQPIRQIPDFLLGWVEPVDT